MCCDLAFPLSKEERERFDRFNKRFKWVDELIKKHQQDRDDETTPPAPLTGGPQGLDLFQTEIRDSNARAARDSAPYLPEPTWPKTMFVSVLWAVVLGVPTWLLWRSRSLLFDLLISALAIAELIRRRLVAAFAELRRRVIERASCA
jgi:hypothetical protein